MIHPHALYRRAAQAERMAEAAGIRSAVGLAQLGAIEVSNARWALSFLRDRPRPTTAEGLAWSYRAFRHERERCRHLLRAAGKHIAQAEDALLEEMRERAAGRVLEAAE